MKIFMSTGEASGDMLAASFADAIRNLEPDAVFSGIGGERMERAGFSLSTRTRGWATLGPVDVIARLPLVVAAGLREALKLRAKRPDLIVLIDFGAFNVRLGALLRGLGYRGPILYFFPPGAWLDRVKQARLVASTSKALTPFVHQRDFYRSLGLPIAYFGHPLVSLIAPRATRPVAPGDAGVVALLPGSRRGEIERHMPRMLAAAAELRKRRPRLEAIVAAADADCERRISAIVARVGETVRLVRGAPSALAEADAALVASGTAVLEGALSEVPLAATYVVPNSQVKLARRIWNKPYITLPNLVLGREVVPELLQEAATPEALAEALEVLLKDPARQLEGFRELRAALGPADALPRCAEFALDLAREHRVRRLLKGTAPVLRIYHTSDLHDHRGIAPRLRALREAAPGFLFDCGDSLRGSQTVYFKREPIVADLDAAEYDAQGVGNREFHYIFRLMSARAGRMQHPLVCSNLVDLRGRALPFRRYLDFERDGWRVRVFGLLVVQYPASSPWERVFGWRFLDPITVAREIAAETPSGTALVALSHVGLARDRELAKAVPRLDLILGGHSHDTLSTPEYVGGVPIVHAGPYGAYASRTELVRDGARMRVSSYALEPLLAAA